MNTEEIALHPAVKKHADRFIDQYAITKNPRILEVQPALGKVDITLESGEGSERSFSVNPVLVRQFPRCSPEVPNLLCHDTFARDCLICQGHGNFTLFRPRLVVHRRFVRENWNSGATTKA